MAKTSSNRRKAIITAILTKDKKVLQAIADEKESKIILISNEQEEKAYLFGLYKHTMSQAQTVYPDARIVDNYTPASFNLISKALGLNSPQLHL